MKRVAQKHVANTRDEREQRRKVHVAPSEMVATSEKVELVAEVAVASICEHLQRENGRRQNPGRHNITRHEAGQKGAPTDRRSVRRRGFGLVKGIQGTAIIR